MKGSRKIFLQHKMLDDLEKFIEFLEFCGFKNPRQISDTKLRLGWDDNSTGNSTIVDLERMTYKRFSVLEDDFTIFDMVTNKLGKDDYEVDKLVCEYFNIRKGESLSFAEMGRLMKQKLDGRKIKEEKYDIVPESKIGKLEPCSMFLNDYISIATQIIFKVHYRNRDNRIIINWRDSNGDLVGFVGRLNITGYLKPNTSKYFTYGNFKKGLHLFGFYENKDEILESGMVIVSESEKATMQMHSYGCYNGVSLGSSALTNHQIALLKKFNVETIILNFDKDKDVEHIRKTYKKIKKIHPNSFVLYIQDVGEEIGEKDNICDYGREKFYKYLDEMIYKCEDLMEVEIEDNKEDVEIVVED